jgi:monovalent cation:H+ antiporter-2, CPA2 family
MPHHSPLIATIVIALALAFVFGALANRLRLPPLIGYLIAGVLIGPATPGFVADQTLASELAEIGVILLMFGVGLHFSLEDLLSVKSIAVPGAIVQIVSATLLGMGLAHWLGWTAGAGLVFGLALSVASTVVLLRALQERRLVETARGRIAVGWLIVEDIVMVLTLVLLPAFAGLLGGKGGENAGLTHIGMAAGLTIAKIAAFVAVMLIVGKRVIPWVLHAMAHTGSRELFRLAVFVIALGVAYAAAELFGVSFALGAFFAGMILSESPLSQRAAEETLPLRDAFAVIFFVSVGMLFKPAILIDDPLAVLATLAIILLGKSLAALAIVRLFRYPAATALLVSVSLAQIGEFSFILAGLGVDLDLLSERGRNLILAGAILSILLNPLLFAGLDMLQAWRDKRRAEAEAAQLLAEQSTAREPVRPTALRNHVVLVGHGRVGSVIRQELAEKRAPLLVIENDEERLAELKQQGIETIAGNAADPEIIDAANLPAASCLLVAIPDAFEGGQVVEQARALSPKLSIIARAHSEAEVLHLKKHGASVVILGEHEIARAMAELVAPGEA